MKTAIPAVRLIADPVVLSRDALLDADAVAEQLSRLWHHELAVESCNLRRAKYRIGESLRVVYDVVAEGKTFVMSARTFADSGAAFRQSVDAAPVHGMPGVAHDPATNSVWWTVPNDRRLRNIGTLLDPPPRVRQNGGVDWQDSALVEYAPERSATVCIRGTDGQVCGYAKAYRDRDPYEVASHYNSVAASIALIDGMRTPRALGWARPDRIVVLEPMRGMPWTQLPSQAQPLAAQRFGSALAHVHGLATDFGRGSFQRYRPDRVRHSADLVAIARPDVAAVANRLRDNLAGGPPASDEAVCLHGDVHANNVLFHGDDVHIIDFDQGGSGASAADIGSMLASFMAYRLLDPDTAVDGLGAAFLAGYGAVRPLPTGEELGWYTAAAFVVERAIRAVNRVYAPTLAVLPELLHLAEDVLAGKTAVDG